MGDVEWYWTLFRSIADQQKLTQNGHFKQWMLRRMVAHSWTQSIVFNHIHISLLCFLIRPNLPHTNTHTRDTHTVFFFAMHSTVRREWVDNDGRSILMGVIALICIVCFVSMSSPAISVGCAGNVCIICAKSQRWCDGIVGMIGIEHSRMTYEYKHSAEI